MNDEPDRYEAPRLRVSRNRLLRNRIAAAILRGLEGEPEALREFTATQVVPPDETSLVAERVAAGFAVAEAYRREASPTAASLERALVQAALLFRAGLFFEVHEVLENVWRELEGARRTFVQGLLQVAVALHHLAHDNSAGAASLLGSGRAKLADHGLVQEGVEVEALCAGLEAWEVAAGAGRWPTGTALPPFTVRTADGRRIGAPPLR